MSLITDLLSKVTQTKPLKDVPPGLTNSINSYKKRETNRKKAIFFSVVIIASLVSGFGAIYAAKLLIGADEVRTGHTASVAAPEPSLTPAARQDRPAPTPVAAASEQTPPPAQRAKAPEAQKTAPAIKDRPAATAQKSEPAKARASESPDALRHYYMALDFEKEGDYIKAIDEYSEALAIEPGNFRLMNKVGGLYMRMGMWEEAARHFDSSVAENRSYVPALINRGIVYAEMKRFEEAEGSLKEALRLRPADRLALFNIALLYEKQSMNEDARESYMKLEQLGDPQGAEGLKRLSSATAPTAAD